MDCNKLKTNTPTATWNEYEILGECNNGSFKKTFLAKKELSYYKKELSYYMISCVLNIVENKKELDIMNKIRKMERPCQYLINLVDHFTITRDSLNQFGGTQFCESKELESKELKSKQLEMDDLLDSRSGSNGEQARIPITPRLRRLSTQVQPSQQSSALSRQSSALSRQSLPSRRFSAPSVLLSSLSDTRTTTVVKPDYLCLVTEYYKNGTVDDYLKSKTFNMESEFKTEFFKIANQLIHAIECFNKLGYFHNDIKPKNILIDDDFNVKLTDFGISEAKDSTVEPILHAYSDPLLEKYTEKTELYSYGLTLLELWIIHQTDLNEKLKTFFELELQDANRNEILENIIVSISDSISDPEIKEIKEIIDRCCIKRNLTIEELIKLTQQKGGRKQRVIIQYSLSRN